jgi:hypothetical protein
MEQTSSSVQVPCTRVPGILPAFWRRWQCSSLKASGRDRTWRNAGVELARALGTQGSRGVQQEGCALEWAGSALARSRVFATCGQQKRLKVGCGTIAVRDLSM